MYLPWVSRQKSKSTRRIFRFECKKWYLDPEQRLSGRLRGRRRARVEVLDRRGALVAQMLEQDVRQLIAGAAAQRLQDRLVLAHGLAPALALAGEIGGVAHAANPAGEVR